MLRIELLQLKSEKKDLLVLSQFKSFCQLYMQMMQDAVISEVHKICDVLHFLEMREMSGIFSNLPINLYKI